MPDDEWLRLYLEDALDAAGMASIEQRLRHEPGLARRLEEIRSEQLDPALHGVAMAWVGGRLTCPTRAEWSQHLSGLLAKPRSAYLQFHLDVIECPFCRANITDLRQRPSRSGSKSNLADRSARAAGWLKSD
jgi:hypothetical protein